MALTIISAALTSASASAAPYRGMAEGDSTDRWNTLLAAWRLDAPATAPLLEDFYTQHPASLHANDARLMRADLFFYAHKWPEALTAYRQADIRGLSRPGRSLYSYRMALSLIKTGHFNEARKWLADVKGKGYDDVRNFYNAYLDYIAGDFNKAYAGFEKVTPGIKGLEAGYYMLQILYSRREYEKVTKRAATLLHRNPVPSLAPEIHRILGLSYFKLGKYDSARVALSNYFDQSKGGKDPEALYAMGAILYNKGDYSEAADYFEQITTDRTPLAQSAWLYIGQCRLMTDDVQGAILAFEKATAYETDTAVAQTAMFNYITALTRGGNVPFSKSAQMFEAYIRRWPDSPHVRDVEEYLSAAYFNDHDYTRAVQCVDAAASPSASMLAVKQKALYRQGMQLLSNGAAASAESWFSRAAAMKNSDPQIAAQSLLWLGDAQYETGKYAAALKSYRGFIAAAPKGPNRALGLYNMAYAQYKLGDYAGGATTFLKATEARPALATPLAADARVRRADCLYYSGSYAEANRIYAEQAASESADADYAAYRHATLTGLTAGQRDKIKALARFIDAYPHSKWLSAALLEKALTHDELGEKEEAAEAYRRRLAITPDVDIDELLNMARTNDEAGTAPAAQLDVLKRIRRNGSLGADELADIDLYEANALARLNRNNEADAIYERLAGNPSSLSGSVAAVTLAERHIAARKYQEAFYEMSAFTEAGTPHSYWLARGFIALADACNGLGRRELAREYLSALRDNYPGNEHDILSAIQSRLNKFGKK